MAIRSIAASRAHRTISAASFPKAWTWRLTLNQRFPAGPWLANCFSTSRVDWVNFGLLSRRSQTPDSTITCHVNRDTNQDLGFARLPIMFHERASVPRQIRHLTFIPLGTDVVDQTARN